MIYMKSNRFINKIDILLLFITLSVLVWLFVLNFVPGGRVSYVQNFEKRNSFVSDLWPPEAIEPVEKINFNGSLTSARSFIKDNVTFFINPPREFDRAIVEINMILPENQKPKFYVQKNTEWIPISALDNLNTYVINLNLKELFTDARGRYNIKISVPGLWSIKQKAYVTRITASFSDN